MNLAVRRYAYEILVERTVVDRAEAEPVANERLAVLFDVADDVRGVQQPDLFESADRAAVPIRRQDGAPELRLVDALRDLSNDITTFYRVVEVNGLALVERPAHLAE